MRTEDGCIIQECLDGKPDAFGMLVDKYKPGIYAFAYGKLGNFQDAQDVTQEVFVEAYRCLRSLRRWESFVFWIYRIARNHCVDWERNQVRRADREFIADQDLAILEIPSLNSYHADRLNESLRETLDLLPETYREVLVLHYFAGMTSREIAKAVGTSPTAVRMRLSRARTQLREEMTAMMSTAFEGQKLQVSFTFRIVEAVKRIKINPMPRIGGLPWGLSLTTVVIVAVLSLSPHLDILNSVSPTAGSAPPSPATALKNGEISVDVMKISQMPSIPAMQDDGKSETSSIQNALLMAPAAEEGTWAGKSDMPTPRHGISSSVVNGKVYAIGGATSGGVPVGVFVGTVEEYDPATDTWTTKTDMPTKRNWHSASVVDGKIYVIGGESAGATILSTVEEYDPVADRWTRKADMPTARKWLSTSVVNGKIYAIGGNGPRSTVEEYDPVRNTWTKRAAMPTARGGLATCGVNGKIYAVGGMIGNPLPAAATVEEYDPATDTWEKKANSPTARYAHSTVTINGRIYVIGGTMDTFEGPLTPNTDEYTPLGWSSSISPQGKLSTKWGAARSG